MTADEKREFQLAATFAHIKKTRARHWPESAPCPAMRVHTTCSRYLDAERNRTCLTWICPGCGRRCPACIGAADQDADLCDDCAVAARAKGDP